MKALEEVKANSKTAVVVFASRSDGLRLGKSPAGEIAFRAVVDDEHGRIGIFTCPKAGTCHLGHGRRAPAADVLAFMRGHRLAQAEACDEGFWELAA